MGNFHYKGHRKGWALKIETFLGPKMATTEASAIHRKIKKSTATWKVHKIALRYI
jgi:hypothetical protein